MTRRPVPREPPLLSVQEAARLFGLLGAPARLRILLLLRDTGEMCVGDLVAATGLHLRTVSSHLTLLRRGGVAESQRAGKHIFYRVATPLVAEVLRPVGEG